MNYPILVDIDGVLADFAYQYRQWIKALYNKDLQVFPIGQRPFNTWADPDVTAKQDTDLFKIIIEDRMESFRFWGFIPSLVGEDTWARLNMFSEHGMLYFVSNRWGRWAYRISRDWLCKNGIQRPSLILASRKSLIAIATKAVWALDDKWENVWDMKPYCNACLIERPYNASHRDPTEKVGRVATVDQFLDLVEKGGKLDVY